MSSFQLTNTPEEYRYLEGRPFWTYNGVVESIREHQGPTSGSLLLIESGFEKKELALGHPYAYTPIGRICRTWEPIF